MMMGVILWLTSDEWNNFILFFIMRRFRMHEIFLTGSYLCLMSFV